MEEAAPSRRSVAELAGKFKGSAPPQDAAANETDKPVRRRPPRSLHIPKPAADEQEQSPDGTSQPTPAKRNSLIEKLQAQLVLSPTAKVTSPKSPGFRLLPPAFAPPAPGSTPGTASSKTTPTSPVATTPVSEEERPVSFEDPLAAGEGSVLPSMNKSRARHSLRRRPPSRRHRKSSSGDEVGVVNDVVETTLSSLDEPGDKTTAVGGGEGGGEKQVEGEVFEKKAKTDEEKEVVTEDKTDEVQDKTDEVQDKTDEVQDKMENNTAASKCPEQSKEDQSTTEPRGKDEKEGEDRLIGDDRSDRHQWKRGRKERDDSFKLEESEFSQKKCQTFS
ncbi:hypothetical protein Q5P01_019006 [Channa striata]|uniref:FAM21/CAPZIP domain-containing protein n=1 Tax=Channa striata TaxID=64152 RepID=A0AA88M1Q8_CHASR|nr:hypothetical protein Q5P01_019006 [Channa striata]